ncbi:MAG TPA: flagellar biosynthetic protein FliO [Stellaceae bacterium]|jgi:flagellar protein FliO/FliZ|nr:flagellar biosynthetic protein FliO [Stellaceae bacterium]
MTGGMDGFALLFLEIGVIVAVLWALLWWLKRRGRAPGGGWGARDCQIIRQMPLGPRERVIVVRVGAKQLVLGVGSASVSLLCELDEPLASADGAGGMFGDAVRKAVGKWRAN